MYNLEVIQWLLTNTLHEFDVTVYLYMAKVPILGGCNESDVNNCEDTPMCRESIF